MHYIHLYFCLCEPQFRRNVDFAVSQVLAATKRQRHAFEPFSTELRVRSGSGTGMAVMPLRQVSDSAVTKVVLHLEFCKLQVAIVNFDLFELLCQILGEVRGNGGFRVLRIRSG